MTSAHELAHRRPNPWHVGVVSGMASYIDAAAIVSSGIALVIYQHTIGLGADQIGILSATLTFCIAIGALVGGRLGDRFGRRSVFMVTMAMIVVGSALLVFTTSFAMLFVGTVLVGLGTGADLPVSLATIGEACDDRNRGKIIGLSNLLWVGGIIGTIAIASVAGGLGRLGGQIMLGQVGVIAFVLFFLRIGIPESASWAQARDERRAGVQTIRADKVAFRDLMGAQYRRPFLALMGFYCLVNLAANTGGQFGTYLAVNVVGISVELNSQIGLAMFPVGLIAGLWFMKIVDTQRRMNYFALGAVVYALGFILPVVFGFNLATLIVMQLCQGVGGAFAFEGILKVWMQESFPTLLRSQAQGYIIAIARFAAGALALVTPRLMGAGPQVLYAGLSLLVVVGLLIAWFTFRRGVANQFDVESELDPAVAPAY